NSPVYALVVDATTSPSTVYAGAEFGAFKTTNGGGSWSAGNTGLPNNDGAAVEVVAATGPNTVCVVAGVGASVMSNGGGSWSAVNNGLPRLLPSCGELPRCTDVSALAVDATTSPSTVYAGIESGGSVFKTRNGGGSWSPLNAGLKYGVSVECVAVDA